MRTLLEGLDWGPENVVECMGNVKLRLHQLVD